MVKRKKLVADISFGIGLMIWANNFLTMVFGSYLQSINGLEFVEKMNISFLIYSVIPCALALLLLAFVDKKYWLRSIILNGSYVLIYFAFFLAFKFHLIMP